MSMILRVESLQHNEVWGAKARFLYHQLNPRLLSRGYLSGQKYKVANFSMTDIITPSNRNMRDQFYKSSRYPILI